jgi:predicted GH43/DUF377 family glycosyl hydrolase
MEWIKKGLIYRPNGSIWWAKTHGYIPTPDLHKDFIRIYFAGRDESLIGRIGYVDVDIDDPSKIIFVTDKPILDIGEIGCFDDSGVTASSIVTIGNQKYLYYIGWQLGIKAPHLLFTGLAVSDDDGQTFVKHSRIPILDRTHEEPFARSAPYVIFENGIFKMWYWTNLEWKYENGWLHYNNVIRYAESNDGIHWPPKGQTCIVPSGDDYAVGRPWVIREGGINRMWYSTRSRGGAIKYHIDYAESADGKNWTKRPAGISVSNSGWDSQVLCFGAVVDIGDRFYMFYNGNRHGIDGFGYAELQK